MARKMTEKAGLLDCAPFASRRLWSLWDMLQRPIHDLVNPVNLIGATSQFLNSLKGYPWIIPNKAFTETQNRIEAFITACVSFDLNVSANAATRLQKFMASMTGNNDGNYYIFEADAKELANKFKSLQIVMKNEAETKTVLVLQPEKAQMFGSTEPAFGREVGLKFPSITYDMEESAKCLALDRSTASVFHAVRCLEAALKANAKCLDIPDPTLANDRNWGNMLSAIEKKMDSRWPKKTRLGGDVSYFERIFAALNAIKNPYRNGTMHLEMKFTEEEAKYMLEMISGLMKQIASRMDENGLPLA
jgi:hypothetical protein